MAGRGRALRNGVAWDERTGFKEKGRRLKMDGERGILTVDADPVHPQRFVRVPPPDGMNYRPGPAQRDSMGARVDLSYCVASVGRSGNQSSPLALRREPSPFAMCVCVGFPITIRGNVNIPPTSNLFVTAVFTQPRVGVGYSTSLSAAVTAVMTPFEIEVGSTQLLTPAWVEAPPGSPQLRVGSAPGLTSALVQSSATGPNIQAGSRQALTSGVVEAAFSLDLLRVGIGIGLTPGEVTAVNGSFTYTIGGRLDTTPATVTSSKASIYATVAQGWGGGGWGSGGWGVSDPQVDEIT